MHAIKNNNLSGILWMVNASFLLSIFSFIASSIKINMFQSFNISCILGSVICLILFRNQKVLKSNDSLKLYIIRSILGLVSLICWFYVLQNLDFTEATAISYLTPLLNVIGAIFILKEKITKTRILALISALLGSLFILRPTIERIDFVFIIAIVTTIIWCSADLITKFQSRKDSAETQILYVTILMAIFSLPLSIYNWQPLDLHDLFLIILLSLVQLFNNYSVFKAYTKADLTVIVPFDFTRLIFSCILGYIFYDEIINIYTFFGALIILVSTTILARKSYH